MDIRVLLLLFSVLVIDYNPVAGQKCFAMRFKLTRQICEPKIGHDDELHPCINLCTKKRVPLKKCGSQAHCCMHDCRCVLKGAGHVDVPEQYQYFKFEGSTGKVKWQGGCERKLPPGVMKPTSPPTSEQTNLTRSNTTRKPMVKTPTRKPAIRKTPSKPRPVVTTRQSKPRPTTRRSKPRPTTRQPKPRPTTRRSKPRPTTRRPKPRPTPSRPVRRTTRKSVVKTTTARKPVIRTTTRRFRPRPTTRRPFSPRTTAQTKKTTRKPARRTTKRTATRCSTTKKPSGFESLFGGSFTSILRGFGFDATVVVDPC